MKKVLVLALLVLKLASCTQPVEPQAIEEKSSIEEMLVAVALEENISNEDLIKSHLLLSQLVLTESQNAQIAETLSTKSDTIPVLATNYLLWTQTQEAKYQLAFIEHYPTSSLLATLDSAIYSSNYKTVTSPFQSCLANFASDNLPALIKLIQSKEFLGSVGTEELSYQLTSIYEQDKTRFSNVVKILQEDINSLVYYK